jgi:hypothetical protein
VQNLPIDRNHADNPKRHWHSDDGENKYREHDLPGEGQFGHSLGHNGLDASLQVSAGNASYTREGRFDTELADCENALSIDMRLSAMKRSLFIAGELSLFHQPHLDPPNERVKPEDSLDQHVNRSSQIVASADVPNLVCKHCLQVLIS